ncbi:hydrolase [Neobacillus sp. D3-1R]|uniref:hydrolase n=1 Tax=Neobacillus sp. D3-1R TaxID=3445778 RepID=UPI003F9F5232
MGREYRYKEKNYDNSHECEECMEHEKKEYGKKEHENKCKGCICDQLRKLQPGTEVDLFLSNGARIEDVVFVAFNDKNCCAFFTGLENEPPGSTLIVDCKRIDAINIEGREC